MFIKIHGSYRDVVAICDSELIGKKFEQGKTQLDVKEDFFKGEEKSEREIFEIMKDLEKEDAIFNIVGEKAVNTALEAGIITKDGIKEVSGIPFALVLM